MTQQAKTYPMSFSRLHKSILVSILILLILGPVITPFAESFSFPDRYDLVAVLVEQGLYEDVNDYDGITTPTTIKARVDRYASDLQTALPGTRAIIIQVDRFEKPENIAATLERLYFEGDPKEPDRIAYLKGIVIVGDVPLPIVNKKGTRFISLYPYTDFEQKAYLFNPATKDFEISSENTAPQPEVWHGVIRPPISTQSENGKKLLAAYFDKNHLYHLDDPAYSTFDKRVFFQDYVEEKKNLNPIAYKNYLNFLKHQGDIAYFRYTKQLLADLKGESAGDLEKVLAEGKAEIAELADSGIPSDSFVPKPDIPDATPEMKNALNGGTKVDARAIPDVLTKVGKMSDNLMFRFFQVFTKYPNLINDFISYTGRYSDVDSPMNLITAKDQYTISYLKTVNTMMENKVDSLANQIQRDVPLTTGKIEITQYWRRINDEDIYFPAIGDPAHDKYNPEYVNFSPGYDSYPGTVNGIPIDRVTDVSQCTQYRGSKGFGAYSKAVIVGRAFDTMTAMDVKKDGKAMGRTQDEADAKLLCYANANCDGYKNYAGCFADMSFPNGEMCFPQVATDPILDLGGAQEPINAPPYNAYSYLSCLQFHEKDKYVDYLKSVRKFLDGKDSTAKSEAKSGWLAGKPADFTDRKPDEITLFTSKLPGDEFKITLGDVFRAYGWDSVNNPDGFKFLLSKMILDNSGVTLNMLLKGHPKLKGISIKITRNDERLLSSIFYHKEPTNETLRAQTAALITKDLPVDNPRFVTLQDVFAGTAQVEYPDVFKWKTIEDYINEVKSVESRLNSIKRLPENSPPICDNCLTSLISPLQEVSHEAQTKETVIERANTTKILDAISWKNMDIDAKHAYIVNYYIDGAKNPYVGKPLNGYELAYFNGTGAFDKYEFSLNPGEEETDAVFAKGKEEATKLAQVKAATYEEDPDNPFDEAPKEEGPYDLLKFFGSPISPWWAEMEKWIKDLTTKTSEFGFGKKKGSDFYKEKDEQGKKTLENIKSDSSEVESNLKTADQLNLSRIASIELKTDSPVIVGGKRADIKISLKDKAGKLVNDEFAHVTLTLEGTGRFTSDTQNDFIMMTGSQIIGIATDEMSSESPPAALKLKAQIADSELKAELPFSVVSEGKLVLEASTLAVQANGKNEISINVTAPGAGNGIARIGLSDPEMGAIVPNEVPLSDGKGRFKFVASKKSGTLILNATSSSLDPGQLSIKLLPGAPVRLGLTSDTETLSDVAGGQVQISANLYDENGNMVDTNSAVEVEFKITDSTLKYGNLSAPKLKVKDGVSTVTLTPKEQSGDVNIIAQATGLSPASITIKSVRQFGRSEMISMQPDALAVALLGIPAGDVTQENYLGGLFAMNGKTQAVVSLTTPPKAYAKLFEINDQGSLNIPEPSKVTLNFLPANNFTMIASSKELKTDLAQITIVTLKDGQFEVTDESNPSNLADGIYLRKTIDDDSYKTDKKKGALRISKSDSDKVEVQTNGYVRIFDNDFSIRAAAGKFLTLEILDKEEPVGEIYFVQRFHQDVRIQGDIPDAPGIYLRPLPVPPQIMYQSVFTGNSSADPKGAAFYDKSSPVTGVSAPGFSYQSLDKSLDRFGVGFTEDNKFALLFAGGETFGEANRPYASDIGIVVGDPSIRVNNRTPGTFSSDTGKLIYSGEAEAKAVLNLDYNTDGLDDILIAQEDGKVRLLQNYGGYDQLKDQGYLLNVKNGIQDITKADVNSDSQMDLIIAAKIPCRQGDTCIDIYENKNGAFVRNNLSFPHTEKTIAVKAADLNNDGYPDLVFADTAGDIKVLYNRKGVIETAPQLIGNVGLQVDPKKNLISSVLVNYPGMTTKNPADPILSQAYQTLSVKELGSAQTAAALNSFFGGTSGADVKKDAPIQYAEKDFIYADLDLAAFTASTKFGQNLSGGVVKTGDRIRYTITLKNGSGAVKEGVSVSDVISDQVELDTASIKCTDCSENELVIEPLNGDNTRPYLFKNITIPAHGEVNIVYEVAFKGDTDKSDQIKLIFNSNFSDTDQTLNEALTQDKYIDVGVTKEGNPTGRLRYFYTTGIAKNGDLLWNSSLSSPPEKLSTEELSRQTGLSFPTTDDVSTPTKCLINGKADPAYENKSDECEAKGGLARSTEAPKGMQSKLKDLTHKDSSGSGIPDVWNDVSEALSDAEKKISGALDNVADLTKSIVSKLTCSAGCIAMPMNVALLAPGFFTILGVPDGYDVGTPIIGWGLPNPPYVGAGSAGIAGQGGRFYISPTLTGGIGFAVCLGTYGTPKNCYSFGINPLDLISPGLCDKINGAVSGALSAVNDVVSSVNEGMTLTAGGGGGTTDTGSRRSSGSGLGNYSLGSYESPVTKSRNIRTPGFPSVITDWWAKQMEEFTDKVLNLPDIYLIYPSGNSIIGAFKPTEKLSRTGNLVTNILSYLNSIPIVDIETQQVTLKIPTITSQEIEKYKSDARQWIEDERLEIDKWKNLVGCAGLTGKAKTIADPELCRLVTVDMNGLINSISDNMKALDEWILFPKKILQYREIESFYLGQIIDYLDTIIQYTGGWVKKNTARVAQWKKAVRDIKNVLNTWRGLMDLMIELNESCDKCKTERFSLKDLILKIFMAIPSPPVIPMPKLPDFVIDVSKIQAGVRVQWPDLKFQAAPLTLPKIPRISLGVNLSVPLFKAQIPKIPVIPSPPDLPTLPELPKLNLPKLPDIPPAPKIPGLPKPLNILVSVLKKVVKILCIIRLGFMPTDETLLKTRIEEITARGLSPVLPLDTMFTIQSPTISVTYIDQLKITSYLNLSLDFTYIQKFVEDVVKKVNNFSTSLVNTANSVTQTLSKQIEKATSPTIQMPQVIPETNQLNYNYDEKRLTKDLSAALGVDASELVHYGMQLSKATKSLGDTKKEYEDTIAQIPDYLSLEMETEPYSPATSKRVVAAEDLVLPFQKRLREYRDNLSAYVDQKLPLDLDDFSRFIASQKSPFIDSSLKRFVAETGDDVTSASTGMVKVGSFDVEGIDWVKDTGDKRLIAVSPPQIPVLGSTPGSENPTTSPPEIKNVGIFYIDPKGQSKRLVSYTLESDKTAKLADIDIDNDSDLDKVYTSGRNVFLKRNDRISANESRPVFRPVDIEFWTIYELLPKGMSPSFPKVVNEQAHEATIAFTGSSMENIAGYEVLMKKSPLFFENVVAGSKEETLRVNLIPDTAAAVQALDPSLRLDKPKGEILINDKALTTITANIGDNVRTGDNSSVDLVASDSTIIHVSDNTTFTITQGVTFELTKGNIQVDIPKSGSLLFPGSTLIHAIDGVIRFRLFDGSEMTVENGSSFTIPDIRPVKAALSGSSGSVMFTGSKRDIINPESSRVHIEPGELLHPLQVVRVKWNAGSPSEQILTLSKDLILPVPDSFSSGMDIEMDAGSAEIIRSEKVTQPAASGMALNFSDKLEVRSGSAEVRYVNGGNAVIRPNETYILSKGEITNPTMSLILDPGFYTGRVYAFDSKGERSNSSEKFSVAPQVCGDTNLPTANIGGNAFTVAVGKILKLDTSRSFDIDGKITSYWINTDTSKEDILIKQDGDPMFTVGPFAEVGEKKMRLRVFDEANNEGTQDFTVKVITPRLVLDKAPLKSNIISGYIEPPEERAPITIARLRPGTSTPGWEILKTPSADADGQYYTDSAGKFKVTDLDLRDRLVVRNQEGKIVAEINPDTGRITILDNRYETRVLPLTAADYSLRIGIFLKTDDAKQNPLTFEYFVPDINTDTVIDKPEIQYDDKTYSNLQGVHIKPLTQASELGSRPPDSDTSRLGRDAVLSKEGSPELGFGFVTLAGYNQKFPGATAISKGGKGALMIAVNGEVISSDPSITVKEKIFKLTPEEVNKQPVVFEILYSNEVIAEIFIAAKLSSNDKIHIVDAAAKVARPQVTQPFTDIKANDPFAQIAGELYKRGIIAGYPSTVKGQLLYKPENLINRAEFTAITLKMFCIIPRPEAYNLPSPFNDVMNIKEWFYPILKEGNIRGFIRGYGGRPNTGPIGAVQTPFIPANNITWGEAATVVLAALQEEDVIDLKGVDFAPPPNGNWYDPYLKVAQNLRPYLKNPQDKDKIAFLVTPEEARRGNEPITRKDFAIMAQRVLLFHDCYRQQTAAPQGIAPQKIAKDQQGMFITRPLCDACPCRATIGSGLDLRPEDIIFAALTGKGGTPIYAKSNEEKY